MEKKQSSIDLFAIALYEKGFLKGNGDEINDLLEEHKAMHKVESELLFECGRNFQLTGEGIFNQVYNETFGGNNE